MQPPLSRPAWSSTPLDDPEALFKQSLASDSKWVPVNEPDFRDLSIKSTDSQFVPLAAPVVDNRPIKPSKSEFSPSPAPAFEDKSMKLSESKFVPLTAPTFENKSMKPSESDFIPVVEPDIRDSSVKASVKLEPYNPNAEFAQSLASNSKIIPLAPTPTKEYSRLEIIEESNVEDTKLKNAISVGSSFMSVPDVNTTEQEISRPPTGLDSNGAAELKRLDDMLFSYLNDQPNQFK